MFSHHDLNWKQLLTFIAIALTLPVSIVITAYQVWHDNGREIISTMNATIVSLSCSDSGQVPLFTAGQIAVRAFLRSYLNASSYDEVSLSFPFIIQHPTPPPYFRLSILQ